MNVAPVAREMTQARIDAYADASGDHNRIHVDPAFAATTPLGGTIAHGMLVLGIIGEMMHAAHGRAWIETGRLKVRFRAPTRSGDTVTATAEAATAEAATAEGASRNAATIEYAIQCVTQNGEVVIDGRASVQAGRDE
jgi:acyl dehydratase